VYQGAGISVIVSDPVGTEVIALQLPTVTSNGLSVDEPGPLVIPETVKPNVSVVTLMFNPAGNGVAKFLQIFI
jgi:hypothetical protein